MFNEKIYYTVFKELQNRVNYGNATEFINMTIASIFAKGKGKELGENWIKNKMIWEVQEGFLEYEEALALKPIYMEAIEEAKKTLA